MGRRQRIYKSEIKDILQLVASWIWPSWEGVEVVRKGDGAEVNGYISQRLKTAYN